MAQRDYAARSGSKKKKQNKGKKSLLIALALLILAGFAGALYLLKEKAPEAPAETAAVAEKKQPKSVLPSRPEEVWTYIQALETRTIPVNDNAVSVDKNMQLTAEQKKILLEMEKEQKQAEERRKAEAAQAQQAAAQPSAPVNNVAQPAKPAEPAPVETAKKPTAPKPAEPTKPVETVKAEPKAEVKKAEPKPEPAKKAETPAPTENAVASSDKKYGLQCGTFKSRENAENLQARLVLAGLNARVNTSGEWNRVQVGPIGDRNAAVKAQERAKSIIGCVVIGM